MSVHSAYMEIRRQLTEVSSLFSQGGPENQIQIVRLGNKHLELLSRYHRPTLVLCAPLVYLTLSQITFGHQHFPRLTKRVSRIN